MLRSLDLLVTRTEPSEGVGHSAGRGGEVSFDPGLYFEDKDMVVGWAFKKSNLWRRQWWCGCWRVRMRWRGWVWWGCIRSCLLCDLLLKLRFSDSAKTRAFLDFFTIFYWWPCVCLNICFLFVCVYVILDHDSRRYNVVCWTKGWSRQVKTQSRGECSFYR